jgi:hypothetical protein
MKKRNQTEESPPSFYYTMPYYFLTGQVDNIGKPEAPEERESELHNDCSNCLIASMVLSLTL